MKDLTVQEFLKLAYPDTEGEFESLREVLAYMGHLKVIEGDYKELKSKVISLYNLTNTLW